jgi:hypothetical protein
MDLKQRLAALDRSTRRPRAAASRPAAEPSGDASALASGLGLVRVEYPGGALWFRDDLHPQGPARPSCPLPSLDSLFTREVPADLRPGQILFLDTETTGLAGGTGSLAFLVGCGWWQDAVWRTRQFFLPGPGRELPILTELASLARSFRGVMTFNGNGFDLPLLRTRALLSRVEDPLARLASWDLLPAARRLWGRGLADCRQQTLEELVRGHARGEGDIPGWQIPGAYFGYLREGQTGDLERVLRHNRRDLGGMAEILLAIVTRAAELGGGPQACARDSSLPWEEAWANGRICELRADRQGAAGWLALALARLGWEEGVELPDGLPEPFCCDAVRSIKRVGGWRCLEGLLAAALRRYGDRPWLHREAAILYEHRLGRLHQAHHHALRLGEPVRLARLVRKLALDKQAVDPQAL